MCGVCLCLSVTCIYSIKFLLSVSSLLLLFVLSLSLSLSHFISELLVNQSMLYQFDWTVQRLQSCITSFIAMLKGFMAYRVLTYNL